MHYLCAAHVALPMSEQGSVSISDTLVVGRSSLGDRTPSEIVTSSERFFLIQIEGIGGAKSLIDKLLLGELFSTSV